MTKYFTENDFQNLRNHFLDSIWIVDEGFWQSGTASYFIENIPEERFLVVPSGERCKTWKWLEYCLEWLCKNNWPMTKPIVGIGGGATLDLAALVAHLYKRGTPFISIPTTTLAMVDASLGAKCGINAYGMKNMVGAVHEPLEHYTILALLGSDLQANWVIEGMSEAYKHGLIQSQRLTENVALFLKQPQRDLLRDIIEEASFIKRDIVDKEGSKRGIRHLLNLGHTTAHGFEAAFLEVEKELSHGSAVAIGLVIEAYLMQGRELAFEIAHDLKTLLPDLRDLDLLWTNALICMRHDKKGDGSTIALTRFGKRGQMASIAHNLDEKEQINYGNKRESSEHECWIKNTNVDELRDCWKSFYHDFS